MQEMSRSFVGRMQHLLERGAKAGVFRKDLDPVQVNITIAAVGYYYLTNRFTGSIVFERDLMSRGRPGSAVGLQYADHPADDLHAANAGED